MSTRADQIEVNGIRVDIVRKAIKNLHLGVYPPGGRVRVAAPEHLSDEAVRLAVVSRLGWIRRKQEAYATQERQSAREMVTGESHYVQGRRYRLDVVEVARPSVCGAPRRADHSSSAFDPARPRRSASRCFSVGIAGSYVHRSRS